jgi:hypothetical protein
MSSCGQDSSVFSATVNEVNENGVYGDTKTAISHGGCYLLAFFNSSVTHNFLNSFATFVFAQVIWQFVKLLLC